MLKWALVFLVVAIVAAVLGFGGIASTSSWVAQTLLVIFLVLAAIILAVVKFIRRNA